MTTVEDIETVKNGGNYYADLANAAEKGTLVFTFHWKDVGHWENSNIENPRHYALLKLL